MLCYDCLKIFILNAVIEYGISIWEMFGKNHSEEIF